jgi:hypothetical protein
MGASPGLCAHSDASSSSSSGDSSSRSRISCLAAQIVDVRLSTPALCFHLVESMLELYALQHINVNGLTFEHVHKLNGRARQRVHL